MTSELWKVGEPVVEIEANEGKGEEDERDEVQQTDTKGSVCVHPLEGLVGEDDQDGRVLQDGGEDGQDAADHKELHSV